MKEAQASARHLVIVVLLHAQMLLVEEIARPAVVESHTILLLVGVFGRESDLSHPPREGVLPTSDQRDG